MNHELFQILLVEDNPNDLDLAMHALKKNNLINKIQVARDGQEALDFIYGRGKYEGHKLSNGPKLILLDLKLPKIDGIEVLRVLKADERTRMIPVVVMTSSREERDLVETYKLGVNSYIIKPVDFIQFTEAVKNLGFYWMLLNQIPQL